MIIPENRRKRKLLYKSLDPENKIQKIGYDYLDNDAGACFKKISQKKYFYPPYDKNYNIKQH